jgi:hypothetical protein
MNRFVKTIRDNVKYPNKGGDYGKWDALNFEQRRFLVECADFMESMDYYIQNEEAHKPKIVYCVDCKFNKTCLERIPINWIDDDYREVTFCSIGERDEIRNTDDSTK